jgi:hypothetical protein
MADDSPHTLVPVRFDRDNHTRVETVGPVRRVRLGGLDALVMTARVRYLGESSWPDLTTTVIKVVGDNCAVFEAFSGLGAPDIFIGVRDGCAGFGGTNNRTNRCVNRLTLTGPAPTTPASGPGWVITDHFQAAWCDWTRFGLERASLSDMVLSEGDVVRSVDERFPFQFRALAQLRGRWGISNRRIGRHTITAEQWGMATRPLGGVWLFAAEKAQRPRPDDAWLPLACATRGLDMNQPKLRQQGLLHS